MKIFKKFKHHSYQKQGLSQIGQKLSQSSIHMKVSHNFRLFQEQSLFLTLFNCDYLLFTVTSRVLTTMVTSKDLASVVVRWNYNSGHR